MIWKKKCDSITHSIPLWHGGEPHVSLKLLPVRIVLLYASTFAKDTFGISWVPPSSCNIFAKETFHNFEMRYWRTVRISMSRTSIVCTKCDHFVKKLKTSGVRTTDRMVETPFSKLRGTSDTFVGRAYSIPGILFVIWCLRMKATIWLLILSFRNLTEGRSRVFYRI